MESPSFFDALLRLLLQEKMLKAKFCIKYKKLTGIDKFIKIFKRLMIEMTGFQKKYLPKNGFGMKIVLYISII